MFTPGAALSLSWQACQWQRTQPGHCCLVASHAQWWSAGSLALLLTWPVLGAVCCAAVTYNDGFLGKTNEEYCQWITNKKNW
jgi:hypothetical protein